jgi:hypothetical protein
MYDLYSYLPHPGVFCFFVNDFLFMPFIVHFGDPDFNLISYLSGDGVNNLSSLSSFTI